MELIVEDKQDETLNISNKHSAEIEPSQNRL